jgi:putative endonuclease
MEIMSSFYYTYVLMSRKDNQLYIGWTDDLRKRLIRHNQGLVRATKMRVPLVLIYYEACLDKVSAIKREKVLKTGFGRKFLKLRVGNIPL